jgi:hypothetical protein
VGLGRRPGPAGYVMLGSLPRVSSVVPACGSCLQLQSRCRKVGWCPKCGLVIADDVSALKGRPSKAQANGLGGNGKRIFHLRPQALKGRDKCESRRSPLQGSTRKTTSFPRPLAWALLGRPFGAVSYRRIPVASLKDRANTHSGHRQNSRSHGVEELRRRSTENPELTATLVLGPQAGRWPASPCLLGSPTIRFQNSTNEPGMYMKTNSRGVEELRSREAKPGGQAVDADGLSLFDSQLSTSRLEFDGTKRECL